MNITEMQAALIHANDAGDAVARHKLITEALESALGVIMGIHRILDGDPHQPGQHWESGADLLEQIAAQITGIQLHIREPLEFDGETFTCHICAEEVHLSIPSLEAQGEAFFLREHLASHAPGSKHMSNEEVLATFEKAE